MELTNQQALQYMQQKQNGVAITQQDVEQLLAQVRGTTFAGLVQITPVAPAAAHKGLVISKVTVANVQLFNNLADFTNAYENAVRRSAAKLQNDAQAVAQFESQGNWFTHTQCYSIVKHNTKNDVYLFAIYNNSASVYVMDGTVVDKRHVAQFLTPSAAKQLLEPEDVVHNVTHDITHSVHVRTTKLDNVVSISAMRNNVQV